MVFQVRIPLLAMPCSRSRRTGGCVHYFLLLSRHPDTTVACVHTQADGKISHAYGQISIVCCIYVCALFFYPRRERTGERVNCQEIVLRTPPVRD